MEVPELPGVISRTLGAAERTKSGTPIATEMFVVAVSLPEVPVRVTVAVPRAAELLAVNVSTLVPEVGFVLHDAVTPLGSAEVTAS